MKPQSFNNPQASYSAIEEPGLSSASAPPIAHASKPNSKRLAAEHPGHTLAYPWLLLVSTTMAAVFCFMYITKPMNALAPTLAVKPVANPTQSTDPTETTGSKPPGLLPDSQRLPGDAGTPLQPKPATPRASRPSPTFEETNLQIQHVLSAEAPGGDLSRIVINVPVLYQSRNLGWTASDVAESRKLLNQLSAYQEKVRALRDESTSLLAAWNRLVDSSVPDTVLRADSPSLTANQGTAESSSKPSGLDSAEAIQIQSSDK